MSAGTRERIVEAGSVLFRRQGYAATGLKAIAAESGAPIGSIYHFVPGGKDALSDAVIRAAGRAYGALVPLFFDGAPDVTQATRNAFSGAAETLRAGGYADACPIAAVALEVASTNETLRLATAAVFGRWVDLLAERYAAACLHAEAARDLATAFVVTLEGATVTACLGERTCDAISGWRGPDSPPWPASMDSELRFYAALWGAYELLVDRI